MRYKVKARDEGSFQQVKTALRGLAVVKAEAPRRFTLSVENLSEESKRKLQQLGAVVSNDYRYEPD